MNYWRCLSNWNCEKIKGNPVQWKSPNGLLAITCALFDLGPDKFKLYLKRNTRKGFSWEYQIAMDSLLSLEKYAKNYYQYRKE